MHNPWTNWYILNPWLQDRGWFYIMHTVWIDKYFSKMNFDLKGYWRSLLWLKISFFSESNLLKISKNDKILKPWLRFLWTSFILVLLKVTWLLMALSIKPLAISSSVYFLERDSLGFRILFIEFSFISGCPFRSLFSSFFLSSFYNKISNEIIYLFIASCKIGPINMQ